MLCTEIGKISTGSGVSGHRSASWTRNGVGGGETATTPKPSNPCYPQLALCLCTMSNNSQIPYEKCTPFLRRFFRIHVQYFLAYKLAVCLGFAVKLPITSAIPFSIFQRYYGVHQLWQKPLHSL